MKRKKVFNSTASSAPGSDNAAEAPARYHGSRCASAARASADNSRFKTSRRCRPSRTMSRRAGFTASKWISRTSSGANRSRACSRSRNRHERIVSPPAPVEVPERDRIPRFDRPMVGAVDESGGRVQHAGQQVVRENLLPVLLRRVPRLRAAATGGIEPRTHRDRRHRAIADVSRAVAEDHVDARESPAGQGRVELARVSVPAASQSPLGSSRDRFRRSESVSGRPRRHPAEQSRTRWPPGRDAFRERCTRSARLPSRGSSRDAPSSVATGRRSGIDRACRGPSPTGIDRPDPRPTP